ncbi:MAG: SLC13 family permease [Synergistetes bacterium]|nr:SLC13 family permease [Synergistota bacterium]MCX8128393.1 SLC13 family permease [Synergistota bacterium]MDW8192429.1 SLC13 family permease [Synergistota bacterium]
MDLSSLIFIITYILLAIGQPPIFRIDRTGAVLIGATAMLALKVISIQEAYSAIDYKTIATLFGLMVLVAHFRLSGALNLLVKYLISKVKNPSELLYFIIFSAGILSAFLMNDTICLLFTPLVLKITKISGLNPKPFLLALCMSANIGSVATITGNPQNLIIGISSGLTYSEFFYYLFPVAILGLLTLITILKIAYKKELSKPINNEVKLKFRYKKPIVIKFYIIALLCLIGFFIGLPIQGVAMITACLLLITRRIKPEKVYNLIDFKLLVLFIGLFIIIKSFENSALFKHLSEISGTFLKNPLTFVSSVTILSNAVSNVPAVLIFKPFIETLSLGKEAWLYLAMSSTLAGNLTVLGSIANIIVIESAYPKVKISFLEYLKLGLPVTTLTLLIGTLWLKIALLW